MVYTKPENKADSVLVFFADFIAAQKLTYSIVALFYGQNGIVCDFICAEKPVTRGNKIYFFFVLWAKLGLYLTAKAIVKASEIITFIIL